MKKIFSRNKKGFEMSFAVMFSIIAGAIILFLAIYATTQLINTSQYALYSESAQSLSNLLNPISNDISAATKAPEVSFKKETRIYLGCDSYHYSSPIFGRQVLSFSEESGFIKKWTAPGANISRSNKYIFGESIQQGTSLNLFSTPFYLGFKVDDLIFMSMNNYCFVASPESIVQEIQSLQIKNINFTNQVTNCKKNSITVCFGFDADCNITVYPDSDYTS